MILGMGNDICNIRRIEQALARFGNRFEQRIFTPAEQLKAQSREKLGPQAIAATYAKRFAAKEACAKALGTGLSKGIFFQDMEVTNLPSGKPTMRLSGAALKQLNTLLPAGHKAAIHLSLSDDYPTASAQVIIEAVAS